MSHHAETMKTIDSVLDAFLTCDKITCHYVSIEDSEKGPHRVPTPPSERCLMLYYIEAGIAKSGLTIPLTVTRPYSNERKLFKETKRFSSRFKEGSFASNSLGLYPLACFLAELCGCLKQDHDVRYAMDLYIGTLRKLWTSKRDSSSVCVVKESDNECRVYFYQDGLGV